jgi:hypothetical protein
VLTATRTAYVYVLRSGTSNVFKIGRALDRERRMRNLATGNPQPLSLFACIETEDATSAEKYLHHRLRSHRSQRSLAREFFEIDPEDLAAIIDDARAFLDDFIPKRHEAEQLAAQESDGRVLAPGTADWERYANLIDVRESLDGLELKRRALEAGFKIAIGSADGIEGLATWRSQSRGRFDQEALRVVEPAIFERFVIVERHRPFRLR